MTSNNKRIAKNTAMLYFRMLITMAVSLYTIRIILDSLGIVDYGIYNVVGGVVTMFSFLSNTLSTSSQRYFSYEIGKKNTLQLSKTFNTILFIYFILAIVIFILAETIGIWLINNKLTIPSERLNAANWAYQFSMLSFMMSMITIPYNALIISREHMSIFAWVSIFEVIIKLIIAFLLPIITYDKLIFYSISIFISTTLITVIYRQYCIKRFIESKIIINWDKELFNEIISFSGWNLFGALSGILNNQGLNIALNIFFGPIVNTARGVAIQISTALNSFVLNFMTATRPQIIKYYANGENRLMLNLIFQSSKFSFLLLLILGLPLLIETNQLIELWLKDVPDYTVIFTKLIVVTVLIDSISYSLQTAAQSTGKIKKYQYVVGGIMMINLPIAFIFLKTGFAPESIFYLSILNSILCLIARLLLLNKMIGLKIKDFLINVIKPIFIVSVIIYFPMIAVVEYLKDNTNRLILVSLISIMYSCLVTYILGLTKNEKFFIKQLINKK